MLQKLDTEHLNRLALAEALASMEPRDFDMRDPIAVSVATRCACLRTLVLCWGLGEPAQAPVQTCSGFRLSKRGSCSCRVNRAKALRPLHSSAGCSTSGALSRGHRYRRLGGRWQALT